MHNVVIGWPTFYEIGHRGRIYIVKPHETHVMEKIGRPSWLSTDANFRAVTNCGTARCGSRGQVVKRGSFDSPTPTGGRRTAQGPLLAVNFVQGNMWVVTHANRPQDGSGRSENRREEDGRASFKPALRQFRVDDQGSHHVSNMADNGNPEVGCRETRRQQIIIENEWRIPWRHPASSPSNGRDPIYVAYGSRIRTVGC